MLDTFIGNEEIKETLRDIVSSGRFPHAFIIEGEVGSGRHTLARLIAAAAQCKNENAPCGTCRECELVSKDGHCDVLTYSPDGATFKIEAVREIRDKAYIVPIESGRKVNILLDCDKMNEPAQNALLKILEEPPSFLVFILICQNASSLLTTVRSRCVTLTVQNPDSDDAFKFIKLKTGKPDIDISEALESTHGNIGKALDLLSGSTAESLNAAKEFFESVKNADRLSALKAVKKLEKDRIGFIAFVSELRLLAQTEAKMIALGRSKTSAKYAAKILSVTEKYEKLLRRHIGQPLSIPLTATVLCAEIFENM